MKSITTTMVLVIFLASSSLRAQTKIGIKAGSSFANVSFKADGVTSYPKIKEGIAAGFFIDAPIGSQTRLQPEVNFVQKGYNMSDEYETDKVTLNYLEVPLNFVYRKNSNGFFAGGGPSIAFGLWGMEKYHSKDNSFDDNSKIEFGSSPEKAKAIDMGVNGLAGYKFKSGFIIAANYNLGLSNLNNDDSSVDWVGQVKNRYFAVQVGYTF